MSGAYDDDAGALFDSAAVSGGEVVLRPWRAGDDLALLQVWGDPANAQQHQDRAMLAEDAERPWRRALVAEDAGVPVAAGVVYASSLHPQRLWLYVETAAPERRRGIGRALVAALRGLAAEAHAAGTVPTAALKARFAKDALVPGTAVEEGVNTEAVRAQTAALAAGTEAFLAAEGFTPVQRSRRVAVAPGAIGLPDVRDEDRPDGVVLEEASTGSVELTQAVAAFYDAVHAWDPSAMSVGAAQQLLLGPATGASGAVVLRDAPKAEGGRIRAFAVSYTPERQEAPADVLVGWDPELSEEDALQSVADLLALLVAQHPVQVEVDEAMAPLERIVDGLIGGNAARTLVDTYVFVDDAGR